MCYETVLTMLTYGNWCRADEDPLAKRRKTSKADSSKTKEQTNQTTDSSEMTRSNKPLLTVRNLVGDRLSRPKNRSGNSTQGGDVFTNVGREVNNSCCIQRYSVPNPSLMFGVRDVRNVWPGRVQIPNEPPRYEYRPSIIARPYPLRVRPVFNSFPVQLPHQGWVRASVRSAFTTVWHIPPECQTYKVTTEPIVTGHSSPIQSLSQMVCSVTAATSTSSTEAHSANNVFTPVRIKSEPSESQALKPTAQPITTVPPASVQARELPKLKPSHNSVQTITYSPSLRTANQSACSVTTTVTTSSPKDLSVRSALSTTRIISPESSTSQTFAVTTQPIMAVHSSSIQLSSSMVGSVTDSTTNLSAEDLSIKTFSTSQIMSSGSSQSQDFKPTAQPSTTPPSSIQTQELPKFQPSRIPVQTIMYSPPSSLRAPKQSFCSVATTTTAFTTSSDEEHAANSVFSATRIIPPGSSTSIATTQSVITTHLSTIQAQEPQKFQPSHIPVQTIMYSPSLRAANQSIHSVTTNTTTTITTSSAEELFADNTITTARTASSGPSKFEDSESTAQLITTAPSSSIQPQEPQKFQPPQIPVQTIMYSPSLRGKSQSACSVTTSTTVVTIPSDEEFSIDSAFTTARIISPGSSSSPTLVVTTQSIMAAHSSSIPSPGFTTASLAGDLSASSAFITARIKSSGSSQAEDSKPIAQPFTTAPPSSLQAQDLSKPESPEVTFEIINISSPPSFRTEESTKPQTPISTPQSIATVPLSSVQPSVSSNSQNSKLTTHLLLLSPPSHQSSEESTSQTTTQPITIGPSSSLQSSESAKTQAPKITTHLLLLSPPTSVQSSEPSASQTPKTTTQPINAAPSSSLQSSESTTTQASKLTTHLLLLSPPTSIQSSESSTSQTSKPSTQPIKPTSSSSESTTTQAPKLTTHLLLLSPPQSRQSSEPSQSQNAPLTKLLLISPPISQLVCIATTPTTTSPAVVSSSIGGESLSEVGLDLEETVIQSVVGAIKVDIPPASDEPKRRMEDEIDEKDALLQRMYSVPAFGGKTVKGAKIFETMLTKPKLCHLFKCMASDCSFTCNQKALFDQHIEMHEAGLDIQKETTKDSTEEDDELYDWQQCAYCCESPTYPTTSLSEHVIAEHGYCVYQCAYCFYRALFQNYVDIHQTLAHRKILRNQPRLIYKCKAFSEGPTVANALKKIGRRRCVRPYHCDQCGSEFLITEEFMNHLLKEHQSVTSYTCHICRNVCFKPDRLVVHYKLHAYSTYQCAYCLHGTETERKMIFHLCTFHFAQPACLYVRAWEEGKQVQSEDKSKKVKNKTKCTNQLECLKMIAYDIEAIAGESTLEEASDEDSGDEGRLVIDDSQELHDIIAELGITTETEPSGATPLMQELASIVNGSCQNVSLSTLLPNATFSLESETEAETVLISFGSSSNSSSN